MRVLGAPEEADAPLAALGELGAAVGDDGLTKSFLKNRVTDDLFLKVPPVPHFFFSSF